MTHAKKIIIFEGIDCVGKTTLYKRFNEYTQSEYLLIDRLTGSMFVYNTFFNRYTTAWVAGKFIESMSRQTILYVDMYLKDIAVCVYVTADDSIIRQRLCGRGDDKIHYLNVPVLKQLYNEYLQVTPLDVIILDSSKLSTDQLCMQLYDKLLKGEYNEKANRHE